VKPKSLLLRVKLTVCLSLGATVLQVAVPKAEEAKPKRIGVRPAGQREAIDATAPTS
jgi:hypothetical protein